MTTREGPQRMPSHPPAFDAVVARFAGPIEEPETGQIWRARWRDTAQLLLLTGSNDSDVEAVPLSLDVDLGDDTAVLLRSDIQPLGFDVVAWRSLRRRLPVRVLDVLLGWADPVAVEAVGHAQGVGAAIVSDLDERSQVRDAMGERIETLEAADWVPQSTEPIDLAEKMRARGLTPSQLASELDIDPGTVIAFVRGDRVPTSAEATRLSPLLNIDIASLTGAHLVDPDLVWALDRPRFRRRLEARGRQLGITDESEWRFRVATQELATAARTTGSVDPRRRWLGLIEDFLGER